MMTFIWVLLVFGGLTAILSLIMALTYVCRKQSPIVISHHVKAIGLEYPPGAFVRINLAWAGSVEEVEKIIKDVGDHKVYLDYPTGRTKPPQPSMTLWDAIAIANKFAGSIEYFAFSNAWDAAKPKFIKEMREIVDQRITLVPKIETKGGVNHLEEIVNAADTNMIMLDAEDLYVNCKHNPKVFDKYKTKCRERCKELGVTCIELKGVVFGYES